MAGIGFRPRPDLSRTPGWGALWAGKVGRAGGGKTTENVGQTRADDRFASSACAGQGQTTKNDGLHYGLLDYFQLRPARQRRRLIIQEHNPPRLGERQIRTERPALYRHLLQTLPSSRIVGIEPGALAQQPAAPAEREQA